MHLPKHFLEHRGFAKKENLDIYNILLKGREEELDKIDKLLKAAANGQHQKHSN